MAVIRTVSPKPRRKMTLKTRLSLLAVLVSGIMFDLLHMVLPSTNSKTFTDKTAVGRATTFEEMVVSTGQNISVTPMTNRNVIIPKIHVMLK